MNFEINTKTTAPVASRKKYAAPERPTIAELKEKYENPLSTPAFKIPKRKPSVFLTKTKVKQMASMFNNKISQIIRKDSEPRYYKQLSPEPTPRESLIFEYSKPLFDLPAQPQQMKNRAPLPSPRTKAKARVERRDSCLIAEEVFAKMSVKDKALLYTQFIKDVTGGNNQRECDDNDVKDRGQVINEKQMSVKHLLDVLESKCEGSHSSYDLRLRKEEMKKENLQNMEEIGLEDKNNAFPTAAPRVNRRLRAERLAHKNFFESQELESMFYAWFKERHNDSKETVYDHKEQKEETELLETNKTKNVEEIILTTENKDPIVKTPFQRKKLLETNKTKNIEEIILTTENKDSIVKTPFQRKKRQAPRIPQEFYLNSKYCTTPLANDEQEVGRSSLNKNSSYDDKAIRPNFYEQKEPDQNFENKPESFGGKELEQSFSNHREPDEHMKLKFPKPLGPVRRRKMRNALVWNNEKYPGDEVNVIPSRDSDKDNVDVQNLNNTEPQISIDSMEQKDFNAMKVEPNTIIPGEDRQYLVKQCQKQHHPVPPVTGSTFGNDSALAGAGPRVANTITQQAVSLQQKHHPEQDDKNNVIQKDDSKEAYPQEINQEFSKPSNHVIGPTDSQDLKTILKNNNDLKKPLEELKNQQKVRVSATTERVIDSTPVMTLSDELKTPAMTRPSTPLPSKNILLSLGNGINQESPSKTSNPDRIDSHPTQLGSPEVFKPLSQRPVNAPQMSSKGTEDPQLSDSFDQGIDTGSSEVDSPLRPVKRCLKQRSRKVNFNDTEKSEKPSCYSTPIKDQECPNFHSGAKQQLFSPIESSFEDNENPKTHSETYVAKSTVLNGNKTSKFWMKSGALTISLDVYYSDNERLRLLQEIVQAQETCKEIQFGIDNHIFQQGKVPEKLQKHLCSAQGNSLYWFASGDMLLPFAGPPMSSERVKEIFQFLGTMRRPNENLSFGMDDVEFSQVLSKSIKEDQQDSMTFSKWPHKEPVPISDLDESDEGEDFGLNESGSALSLSPSLPNENSTKALLPIVAKISHESSHPHSQDNQFLSAVPEMLHKLHEQKQRLNSVQKRLFNYSNSSNLSSDLLDELKDTPEYLPLLRSTVSDIISIGRNNGFEACSSEQLERYIYFLSHYTDFWLNNCSEHMDKILDTLIDRRVEVA